MPRIIAVLSQHDGVGRDDRVMNEDSHAITYSPAGVVNPDFTPIPRPDDERGKGADNAHTEVRRTKAAMTARPVRWYEVHRSVAISRGGHVVGRYPRKST